MRGSATEAGRGLKSARCLESVGRRIPHGEIDQAAVWFRFVELGPVDPEYFHEHVRALLPASSPTNAQGTQARSRQTEAKPSRWCETAAPRCGAEQETFAGDRSDIRRGAQGTSEGWVAELSTAEPNELFGVRRGPWQTKMAKKCTEKREAEWAEAKRKCRLNAEAMRMAKELGLNPRSLIKNIPNRAEPWKAPVHVWIREMYEKRGSQSGLRAARTDEERERLAEGRPVMVAGQQENGTQHGLQERTAYQQP